MDSSNASAPLANPEIAKQEQYDTKQNKQEPESESYCSVRGWLLFWGFLRLVVSIASMSLIIATIFNVSVIHRHRFVTPEPVSRLGLTAVSMVVQLIDFGMIVTFIIAGVKKSAPLYRAYYLYSIATLIIFIVAVILCFGVQFQEHIDMAEIYISYNINKFLRLRVGQGLIFIIIAVLDICAEILVLFLIRKVITKYSYYDVRTTLY